ncbi:MAG: T9SS type A sorting domain-containing protein [Flavobacterium sp.]|uniref:T9SS type A sorting domain-containing protein n=1 Tax=Flavobacterium sp. TaxID=239 RepID=UPI00122A4159|nr:T9SS type A sorting domain-containing protein [Flavobacterium sp.]RZJ63373.1 MAG: T9SS type A sorting domain-containing protein [Flavobacterium sp.]
MRATLLFIFIALFSAGIFAQAPTIDGDLILCPNSNGTATVTNSQVYDSYQWQFRFAFTSDPFEDIPGATSASFTYDAFNYSVTDIRVRVTLGANTYFSNTLLIDGYAFLPIFTIADYDDDVVTIGPDGGLLLCNGGTFTLSTGMPYNSNIQWFKNGAIIDGANQMTYTVTGPGEYYVTASPQVCPNYSQTSLPTVVETDPDCSLGIGLIGKFSFVSWPNPVGSQLSFKASEQIQDISVFNLTGQQLLSVKPSSDAGTIDLGQLASGVYILEAKSDSGVKQLKIVKR